MAQIEELLLDILDDNTTLSLEDCAHIPGVNDTLYAELVHIQATTPALESCKTPISAAEQEMLNSLRNNLISSFSSTPKFSQKLLWGGTTGIVVLAASVVLFVNNTVSTPEKNSPHSNTVLDQQNNYQQPQPTVTPSQPESNHTTTVQARQVEYTEEFRREEQTLLQEVTQHSGQEKYIALRNLYRLYLAMHDTTKASIALNDAKNLAIELQKREDVLQCSKELQELEK